MITESCLHIILRQKFKYQWSFVHWLEIFQLLHLRCTGAATSEARSVGALSVLTTTRMGSFAHRSAISSLRSPRALSSRVPTTLNFSSARFWFIVISASLSYWEIRKVIKLLTVCPWSWKVRFLKFALFSLLDYLSFFLYVLLLRLSILVNYYFHVSFH